METGRRPLTPHLVVAALLVVFVGFGLQNLGRTPKLYEDEAPIVSPGVEFLTTGVFGTPLDGGFAGSDRHCYEFMPLFSILVGASVRIFGPGLFAARLAAVAVVTIVLLLTHLVGARFLSPVHGAGAVALLVLAPVASPLPHLLTGIPLVDMARLVRYDAAVGLFGLAALLVLAPVLLGESPPRPRRFFAAGLLIGAATLCHVYGAFWLVALMSALGLTRGKAALRSAWLSCAAGFLLALLPWIAFVASGWDAFLAQSLQYSERFTLLDPRFYLANVRGEIARYGLVIEAARRHPTPWLFAASGAIGAGLLLRRAVPLRGRDAAAPAVLLVVPAVVALLLAVLVQPKRVFYLATLWPLFALVASHGLLAAWRYRRAAQIAVLSACLVVAGEGVLSLRRFTLTARPMTSYADFTERLSRLIPRDGRVMGMKQYWLGLAREHPDYVAVPFNWTLPRFASRPVPFAAAADSLAPRVFLLDEILRDFRDANVRPDAEFHDLAAALQKWLAARGALLGVVEDQTYGRVEVYGVRMAPRSWVEHQFDGPAEHVVDRDTHQADQVAAPAGRLHARPAREVFAVETVRARALRAAPGGAGRAEKRERRDALHPREVHQARVVAHGERRERHERERFGGARLSREIEEARRERLAERAEAGRDRRR
jgi:hypothetical protein